MVRYAFDLAARGAVSAPTHAQIVSQGGQNHIAVEFSRRATAPGLQYVIEGSSDLKQWTGVGTVTPGEPGLVTVVDPTPITGSSHRFLRVLINYAP